MKTRFEIEIFPYIEKAKNGDIESLEKLLKISEKEIYAILYCMDIKKSEINDIIQEVLLKIANNIKKLKNNESYKSWLNKITLRQYYDFIRKNKKYKNKISITELCENDEISIKSPKFEPVHDCIKKELMGKIKNSLCKLQEPYKIAILMREFEGLSYEEIAALTNTNIGTVKSRISRARNILKEDLKSNLE